MKPLPYVLLIILGITSFWCVNKLYNERQYSTAQSIPAISQLPDVMTEVMSLEFTSLVSDYIMIHVLTFMGEKLLKEEPTSETEWEIIHKALQTVINLDPRGADSFILATTTLPYEAGMIKETNLLLEKVAKFRTDDYRPNFFLWYNHYHFLKDPKKALVYLKRAAAIKNSPTYLKPLASRMHLYTGQIEASIAYTLDIIKSTEDPSMREYMLKRLDALKIIDFLEQKTRAFEAKFNYAPQHLQELVNTGFLKTIPVDHYGGEFYINKEGRVYTTSKLVRVKKKSYSSKAPKDI